jgi:hypothetical protein
VIGYPINFKWKDTLTKSKYLWSHLRPIFQNSLGISGMIGLPDFNFSPSKKYLKNKISG